MLEEHRPVYASSGKFIPSKVLKGAFILFGLGLLGAWFLAWSTAGEYYGIGIILFLPAALIYWSVLRIVAVTKTRNRLVGFTLGSFAGTIVLMGSYHIDQCSRWGVGWERIDRLPGYIAFRTESDRLVKDRSVMLFIPLPKQDGIVPWHPLRASWNWRCIGFLVEVFFLIFVPGMIGLLRAKRPFSELLDEWFSKESFMLTRKSASALRSAMSSGTLHQWLATGVERTGNQQEHTVVTFWYCPRRALTALSESSAYVGFSSSPLYLLKPEEAETLSQLVPGLGEVAIPTEATYDDHSTPPADPTVARLIKVSGPHVGHTAKPGVKWWGRLKLFGMLFSLILAAALPIFVFCMFGEISRALGIPLWGLVTSLVIALVAFGSYAMWLLNPANNPMGRMLVQHYRDVVANEVTLRPDALFSPNRPELVYVEIIQRRLWENLSEVKNEFEAGFLMIDIDQQQLLFEGDRSRYIIPAASILRCELEKVANAQASFGVYAVMLIARTKNGTLAFPISPRDGIDGADRDEKAAALQAFIMGQFDTEIQQNAQHATDGSKSDANVTAIQAQ
jgi:hypothetical protein